MSAAATPYDEAACRAAAQHIAQRIVRPLVQKHWQAASLPVSIKSNATVVTEADRAIEQQIRAYLEQAFPGYGLIGEELGATGTDREYVWTIDPIDGTEAFVAGLPLFGTLLAVIEQTATARAPVFGALYLPVQDRLVIGNRSVTTLDGRPVRMSAPATPAQKRMIFGDMAVIARKMPERQRDNLWRLARDYPSAQSWGDCFGYVSMLTGRAHARVEAGLGVDDIAPLEPIVLGAGGTVTTLDGMSLSDALSKLPRLDEAASEFGIVCAVSDALHREVLRALS
jgi:myo-inositol-1(or 4)-monophosphatase